MEKNQELKSLEKIADFLGTTTEELYEKTNKQTEPQDLSENLTKAFSRLSPKERDVLTLHFGLRDGRKSTLEEIGELFDISKERVRQIEARAILKLKKFVKSKDNVSESDI